MVKFGIEPDAPGQQTGSGAPIQLGSAVEDYYRVKFRKLIGRTTPRVEIEMPWALRFVYGFSTVLAALALQAANDRGALKPAELPSHLTALRSLPGLGTRIRIEVPYSEESSHE